MNFVFQVKVKRPGRTMSPELTGILIRSGALAVPFLPDHNLQILKTMGEIFNVVLVHFEIDLKKKKRNSSFMTLDE